MSLTIPAFNALRGGGDFSSAVYDISGLMEQGRAYAMANNTYVLAGITEVSASQGGFFTAQVSGTGRVVIALIAAKGGTRPYQALLNQSFANPGALSGGWPALYGTGTAFVAVTKVASFQNVHLVDLQPASFQLPTSGAMARPAVTPYYDVANTASCVSATPYPWPLGTKLNSGAQYQFAQVIEFSPEGSARIIEGSPGNNLDSVPYCIEIGLQPSNGSNANAPASLSTGQIAAIQIDGVSGSTRIYRP
jgi:hypothetical protein